MDVTPVPPRGDGGTRAQHVAITVLAVGLFVLGLFTLWDFLRALAWASIFAIAIWPLYSRAVARFGAGRHNILLPTAFTVAVATIFVVPLGVAGFQLAHEAHVAAQWVHDAQENGVEEPGFLHRLPYGQPQLDEWWQQNLSDAGGAKQLVQRTTRGNAVDVGRAVGEQVLRRLALFVFTLVTLFFLFRDGEAVTRQVRHVAARTFGPGGERVGRQIIASVHGTVYGLVLVGIGVGAVLGIVYAVAGVPHATTFGALTAVAAIIPFGAPIVFTLAALLLMAKGSTAWAVAVFGTGVVLTFAADHFVRPILIGGATKLPFVWVLLGILGGVEMWGLVGLFLGPAIMAALILLWREWASEPPR